MSKVRDFNMKEILNNLRIFIYEKNNEIIQAEIFPLEQLNIITLYFNSKFGDLKADSEFYNEYNRTINDNDLANIIKIVNKDYWKHLLGIVESEYNPIWNVDGNEHIETKTTYGHAITMKKGSSNTTEQIDNAESTTEQIVTAESTSEQIENAESITEQIDNAESITEQLAESNNTNISYVAPYDSETFSPSSKDIVTNNQGKLKTSSDAGKMKTTSDAGKMKTTSNAGKMKTTSDAGKIKTSLEGEDRDEHSGVDVVEENITRGGNIGVTMTQQLLTAELDFWNKMNFFDLWFKSISNVISIPIYEED